jgi:hypothetical protein
MHREQLGCNPDHHTDVCLRPSLRPEPHTVASDGHDQEWSRANAVGGHVSSTNRPPQPDEPESAPGGESEHDQKRGEPGEDGRGDSQRYSVGSGPRREWNDVDGEKDEQVNPSPYAPSLVCGGNPEGMWVRFSWHLPPIAEVNPLHHQLSPYRRRLPSCPVYVCSLLVGA